MSMLESIRSLRLFATGSVLCASLVVAAPLASSTPQPISDVACLRKTTLDLMHRGPTAEEINDLASGAVTFGERVDEFLDSPEFSQIVFDWYRREFAPTGLSPAGTDLEEPARIARHLVMNDRDMRELLTGTFTIDLQGKEVPQNQRGPAGVLSTKYYMSSSLGLLRRNWAGRYQRQFTGIVLGAAPLPENEDVDLSRDGIAKNPACAGCHVNGNFGIDHLAKFADCWNEDGTYNNSCSENPEAKFLATTGRGLPDLARITVESNEWKSMMVGFYFKQLFGRGMARSEIPYYLDAVRVFEESGYQARPVIRHLITSPGYCAR